MNNNKVLSYTLLLIVLLSTACYRDLGSYNYKFDSLNTIDAISLSPTPVRSMNDSHEIEFTQAMSENETIKRIEVRLTQSLRPDGQLEGLEFNWYVSGGKTLASNNKPDTIHTKGYLDLTFPLNKDTTYHIMLEVKDPLSHLARYSQINVKTRPIYKNSLFFLHGTEGNVRLGNLELIGKEASVFADAYKRMVDYEKNPFANATKMMYHSTYVMDWVTRKNYELNNLIVLDANGIAHTYNPFGLEKVLTNFRDFVIPVRDNQPRFFVHKVDMVGDPSNQTDYYYAIGKDGRFLTSQAFPCFKEPATSGITDYRVTAMAITDSYFVMWDAKHNRFLYLSKDDGYGKWAPQGAYNASLNQPIKNAFVSYSDLSEHYSPVGKNALLGYIQYRENYATAHPFFIFHDSTRGEYFLYELTPTELLTGGQASGEGAEGAPAYTISAKKLENFNPSSPSTVLYNTWFTTNYVFYANGNNIIRYNTDNGDEAIIYSFPHGYEVACMKIREPHTFTYSTDLGLYLSVGLNKGDKGAVSELKFTTAADLDPTFPVVIYDKDSNGNTFGNILDVQFVHEYRYELPDYMKP